MFGSWKHVPHDLKMIWWLFFLRECEFIFLGSINFMKLMLGAWCILQVKMSYRGKHTAQRSPRQLMLSRAQGSRYSDLEHTGRVPTSTPRSSRVPVSAWAVRHIWFISTAVSVVDDERVRGVFPWSRGAAIPL